MFRFDTPVRAGINSVLILSIGLILWRILGIALTIHWWVFQ